MIVQYFSLVTYHLSHKYMAKYVPDIKTKRWVIIAPSRTRRPDTKEVDAIKKSVECVFCEGSEHATPPEVYRVGGGEKNKPGWQVRVVPNKYPITDTHEVVIHSPDCKKDIEDLPKEQVNRIIHTYRERYRAQAQHGHVLIFCNHGSKSGASLSHPHSQLVVIPRQISLDTLSREPVENVVEEKGHFITYCPDFSQWPFETWIVPKEEGTVFGSLSDSHIDDLTSALKRSILRMKTAVLENMKKSLKDPSMFSYNYYIYHGTNWYIRIIPRGIIRAGFELGTGLSVNIIGPTTASEILRDVKI